MGFNGDFMMISIWVNYNDLTVRPSPGIMVSKGNHPQMAARFRLVNYYNLPRFIVDFPIEHGHRNSGFSHSKW